MLYKEIKICFKEVKIDFCISYIELYYYLNDQDSKPQEKLPEDNLTENLDINFEKMYESNTFGKKTNASNTNPDESNASNTNPDEFKKRKEKFDYIQEFWTKVNSLQCMIKQKENWTILKNDKDLCMKYSQSKGIITSFVDAYLDLPAFNFCTLQYEMSLYKNFIPFTNESEDMLKQGKTGKVAYMQWRVGKFLMTREAYIMGFGWDSLFHKGCLVIEGGSVDWNDPEVKRYGLEINKKSKYTRLDLKPLYMEVYPLEAEKCRVKLVFKVDPKLYLIPTMMINYVFKQMLDYCFKFLVGKAKQLDQSGEWKEKMIENSEFYDWMKVLLDKYLENRK